MSEDWTNEAGGGVHPGGTDDGLPVLSLAAGVVAALAGGAVWAAIAIFGNLEVGWVAWGIGLMVGGAMAATTTQRGRRLATMAAAVALLGLVAGKALTFAGSAGPIADEIVEDAAYMQGMTAWEMYANGELEVGLQEAVAETEARGDTLSDALWAEMLVAADAKLAGMSEADRRALARTAAGGLIRQMGLVNGIRAQLSAFDLLWVFLALATAYRMMDAPKREPEVVAAEPEPARETEPV